MTDMAAAIGLVQLERAEELLAARRALAAALHRRRSTRERSRDLVEAPADAADGSHAWHLYMIRLDLDRLAIDRARSSRG